MKHIVEDLTEGGQPKATAPLIGLKVERAWLFPSALTLLLVFEDGQSIKVGAIRTPLGDALDIEIGELRRVPGWESRIDAELGPQDELIKSLRGRRLGPWDANILIFESDDDLRVGMKFTPDRVSWVVEGRLGRPRHLQ